MRDRPLQTLFVTAQQTHAEVPIPPLSLLPSHASRTSCPPPPRCLPCCDVIILRHGLAHEVTVTHVAGLEVHLIRVQGLHQLQAGDVAELARAPHRHRVGVVCAFPMHVPGRRPLGAAAPPNRRCIASLQPGAGLAIAPGERRGAVGEAGHTSRVGIIAVVTSHLQGAVEKADDIDLVLSPATLCLVPSLGCPSVGASKCMSLVIGYLDCQGTMSLCGQVRNSIHT